MAWTASITNVDVQVDYVLVTVQITDGTITRGQIFRADQPNHDRAWLKARVLEFVAKTIALNSLSTLQPGPVNLSGPAPDPAADNRRQFLQATGRLERANALQALGINVDPALISADQTTANNLFRPEYLG